MQRRMEDSGANIQCQCFDDVELMKPDAHMNPVAVEEKPNHSTTTNIGTLMVCTVQLAKIPIMNGYGNKGWGYC